MEANLLTKDGSLYAPMIWLNAQILIDNNQDTSFSFILQTFQEDWLFIQEGESLILLIDGVRYGFTLKGDVIREVFLSRTQETAIYSIEYEIIKKIAYAKEVKVKVVGEHNSAKAYFSEANFNNYRDFINKYILGISSTTNK